MPTSRQQCIDSTVNAILGIQRIKRDLRIAHSELVRDLLVLHAEVGTDALWDYMAVFQIPSEVRAIVGRETRRFDAEHGIDPDTGNPLAA